jgi:hypothetical protein
LADYPTFEEWLRTLQGHRRREALDLVEQFKALGADDPESWARPEIDGNVAQLTRFLFLRTIWSTVVEEWTRDPKRWVEIATKAAVKGGEDPYYGEAGSALSRVLAVGVSMADIGSIARMVAWQTAFSVLYCIDEGSDPSEGASAAGWVLLETDASGNPTGRPLEGLHDELLDVGRSVREARPS